jgi:hypothetical protein
MKKVAKKSIHPSSDALSAEIQRWWITLQQEGKETATKIRIEI